MKSFLQDAGKYIFGTFSVNESPLGLELVRMNSELAEIYGRKRSTIVRAECSTGVRMRFRTDSQYVGLSLRYGDAARLVYATDVTVKGFEVSNEPSSDMSGCSVSGSIGASVTAMSIPVSGMSPYPVTLTMSAKIKRSFISL